MSNVVLAQKHNSTQMDKLKLSALGDLKVHIQDGLIGAADNDLSDQATKLQVFPYLEKPDGSLTVAKCDASGNLKAELTSSVDVTIGDVDMIVNTAGDGSGTKKHALCDTTGRLQVSCLGNEVGDGSGTARHLHLDATGNVQANVVNTVNVNPANVCNSKITDTPTSAVAVGLQGRTTIGTASTSTPLLCDAAGHLQVDVVSMSGGGDASAANQTTAIGHLSEIEGAVETLEGCVNSNKIRVELEAGDLNIGNVDVASSALPTGAATAANQSTGNGSLSTIATNTTGLNNCVSGNELQVDIVSGASDATAANQSTANNHLSEIEGAVETIEACVSSDKLAISSAQLPASLGQKANASSLSICRSSTTGAFDLSGRTTIGTSGTSTKLLCDSDGFLRVSSESRVEGASQRLSNIILENSVGTGSHTSATIDLGLAHKMNVVKFYINSATGGFNLHLRVSADGTNYVYASGITFQTISISGGGSTHIADPRVVNPPRFVQIYNNDTAATYTISELIVVKSSSA